MRISCIPALLAAVAVAQPEFMLSDTNLGSVGEYEYAQFEQDFYFWYNTNQISLLSLGIDQTKCEFGVWWYTRGVFSL